MDLIIRGGDELGRKMKIVLMIMGLTACAVFSVYFSGFLHQVLSREQNVSKIRFGISLASIVSHPNHRMLFWCILLLSALLLGLLVFLSQKKKFQTESMMLTKNIRVPIVAGQGQHGTARWLAQEMYPKVFAYMGLEQKPGQVYVHVPPAAGGIVVHHAKANKKEQIGYLDKDTHTAIIGATRSGKSRRIVMESILLTGLAGESMVISDPKGELFGYTATCMKELGYQLVVLDFHQPNKSTRYNFLQPIIDAVNERKTDKAVDLIWDLTANLAGESNRRTTEKIWENGEASIIAGSLMAVVFDNQDQPQYQNMSNVYAFIQHMTTTLDNGSMPLNQYLQYLEIYQPNHPARGLFGVAMVAPSRTRGSFFTSALTTLRLFTSESIAALSKSSDFALADLASKKTVVYILLPDAKEAYWSLASLFVSQVYQVLVDIAFQSGGKLDNRVEFFLDEFGNFAKIAAFSSMVTVGGGRGMRFHLFLQSFSQLDEKYGKEASETIKDNCHAWIYLKTANYETAALISKKLGHYTTSSYSMSTSWQSSGGHGNSSSSMNLMARPLLTEDEIMRIEYPYALVMVVGQYPAMVRLPDLSEWSFNGLLGLGDEAHNRQLLLARERARPERLPEKTALWGIWEYMRQKDSEIRQPGDVAAHYAEIAERQRRTELARHQRQGLAQAYGSRHKAVQDAYFNTNMGDDSE
jgi:type IV secretion system protein VirD4